MSKLPDRRFLALGRSIQKKFAYKTFIYVSCFVSVNFFITLVVGMLVFLSIRIVANQTNSSHKTIHGFNHIKSKNNKLLYNFSQICKMITREQVLKSTA